MRTDYDWLQRFAEGAEGTQGTEGAEGANEGASEGSTQEGEGIEGAEGKKKLYTDEDIDAIIARRFAKWEKQKQKEIDEAKRLENMNAQERAEHERDELRCGCRGKYCSGYPAEMQKGVINILEKLRSYYGKPITITSGVRCRTYNSTLSGSASNSMHLYGKAADFYIPGICDTAAGRNQVVQKCYAYGAKYAYCNTVGMVNAVHVNI